MKTAVRVLMIIAIAVTMVQFANLAAREFFGYQRAWRTPDKETFYLARVLVYWFVGAGASLISMLLFSKERILSLAIGSGGFYLMILGANGGFYSPHILWYQLILCALNLALFLVILRRIEGVDWKI